MNVDILFRAATTEKFFTAMESLGVPVFRENEKFEEQLGACSGHPLVTHQGVVRWVRMVPEYLANVPDIILSPETVLIDMRTDEDNNIYDAEGNIISVYDPEYTCDQLIDGVLTVVAVKPGRIGQ